MKITVLDECTNEPLMNHKVYLFIEGRESGKLTIITDENGCFLLNDNFKDHQLSITLNDKPEQWITARDGARMAVKRKETSRV